MRKIISVCIAAIMIMSMFTFAPIVSNAAEPAKLIDFYEEYLYKEHSASAENEVIVSWKDNAMHLKASTKDSERGDPYFTVSGSGGFSADDNPYMVIKLKNLSVCPTFEMHFGTTIHTIAGDTVVHFDISKEDTEYKTYVVNIPEANLGIVNELNGPDGIAINDNPAASVLPYEVTESTWEGDVTDLRLDAMYLEGSGGHVPDGSEMYIEYIAFFGTKEDAEAFAKTGPDRSGYEAPATQAPPEGDEIKPNAEAFIDFSEDSYWDELVSWGSPQGILEDGPNDDGDALQFTVEQHGDPNIQMLPAISIDSEEWPVMQIKVRVPEGAPVGGMIYWTTTNSPSLAEAQTATIRYNGSSDWQYVNIDMGEKKNGLLTGDYVIIRFDMFNASPAEFTYELASCAFFHSVEAAEAYIANGGDYSELKDAKPEKTPAPETPTPSATATPTPTATPTAAPTEAPAEDNGGNTTLIVIIAVVAVVVIAVVVAVIMIMKKKKANK